MRATRTGIAGLGILVGVALGAGPAAADFECTRQKHKVVGAYVKAWENCKAGAKNLEPATVQRLLRCWENASDIIANGFARAEKKRECLTTGDAELVGILAKDFVDDIQAVLEPQDNVCCNLPGSVCGYAPDEAACQSQGGTAGAAGDTCNQGGCTASPTLTDDCCESLVLGGYPTCATGLTKDECEAAAAGAVFVPGGICTRSQQCVRW
jgi:hypothetical protein